jgi:hypothetical protein
VRQATPADLPRLLDMGRKFHAAAKPEWPWSDDGFVNFIVTLPYVSITDGGFLAGTKAPWPLNPAWIVAHEILWWAEDGTGRQHEQAFREWAADAHEIKWSCRADNDRVTRFYSRFATPSEAVFSEVRPCA